MDGYSTHIPALAAVMQIAPSGAVLELGAGFYSTPLLHALCGIQKRPLVTLEAREHYMSAFTDWQRPGHLLLHVKNWDYTDLNCRSLEFGEVAVAFIDHEADRRKIDGERLRHVPILVFHDTNNTAYGLEPLLASFKYRFDYKRLAPWTTVVSDTLDVATLLKKI